MKKVKNDIIKKYEYKDYFVYIKETDDSYEWYLQKDNYCDMSLVFGVLKKSCTYKGFKMLIEINIDEYIKKYEEVIEY